MNENWKNELNRLATEFWFRSGDLAEVMPWVETAYEAGETGFELADLWGCTDIELARSHLQSLAKEINGFKPWSDAAQSFAVSALKRALRRYVAHEIAPAALCRLIDELDTAFLDKSPLPNLECWMGDLWNCCDWCDATWTFDNVPHLEAEVIAVLARLEAAKL